MKKNKRNAYIAILASLSIVINLIENLFIPPLTFGIRFGLANIISLVCLKLFGKKEMYFIVLIRLTLGNILKGTIFGTPFIISASGLLLSSIVIIICDLFDSSVLFTSLMSSVSHSFGQLLAVCYLYHQINIIAILPLLIVGSLLTGILTGVLSNTIIKRVRINSL